MRAGHPVTDAWRPLAQHAAACGRCAVIVAALGRVPEDPGRADGVGHEKLCGDGRDLFTAWWDAKHELLEATTDLRRRQFILRDQLWDDGVSFETRAAAIMAMPGPDFSAWLALPDDRRHAQLRALEAAQADHVRAEAPRLVEGAERTCEHCGGRFLAPEGYTRQRYCSASCRKKAGRARLEPVE